MSVVYVTSDWHLGHENAVKWREGFSSLQEMEETILTNYLEVVKPRDIIWFLGDICLTRESLELVRGLPGDKRLVLGNHDTDKCGGKVKIEHQLLVFDQIHSLVSYKGYWLSHAPIHPEELRGKKNIHGHVHKNTIADERYINACVDVNGYKPILLTRNEVEPYERSS